MKKTKLIEHQVIAHCVAFLISKNVIIDNLAVKRQHIKEVRRIIKIDLIKKYCYDRKKVNKLVNPLNFNNKGDDILGTYYHKRKYSNRRIKIEAKGGNVMYAVYTVIGQLVCSRVSKSPYWWFGFACPSTWQNCIYNKMTFKGKIKPIIKNIIEYTRNGQGLNFYFVEEDGSVKSLTWKRFLLKDSNLNSLF